MDTIPTIVNVADLQRNYRAVASKAKKNKETVLVVSNGRPDMVLMDVDFYNQKVKHMKELEEEYLLELGWEAMAEYKAGKTVTMRKGETLQDVLKRWNDS
jgi:prevent-host-death family protein